MEAILLEHTYLHQIPYIQQYAFEEFQSQLIVIQIQVV